MKKKRRPQPAPGDQERNTKGIFTRLKKAIGVLEKEDNRLLSMAKMSERTGFSRSTLEKVNAGLIDLPSGLQKALQDEFGCHLGFFGELLGIDGRKYSRNHYNKHTTLTNTEIDEDTRLLYAEITALHSAAIEKGKVYQFWRSLQNWERDISIKLGLESSARDFLKAALAKDPAFAKEANELAEAVFPDIQPAE